jgi:heat shock protein 1/8
VQAKNGVESYAFSLKNTLNENGDKFSAEDKEALEKAVNDTIQKLETMESASKEEFEELQKELEGTSNGIMQR